MIVSKTWVTDVSVTVVQIKNSEQNTRCTWAGGTYVNYPDFCENHQFHVIYCVTIVYVLYFPEFWIHDSRRFMIYCQICWACAIFR